MPKREILYFDIDRSVHLRANAVEVTHIQDGEPGAKLQLEDMDKRRRHGIPH